jgi:ketosteroid isomerase-like protein
MCNMRVIQLAMLLVLLSACGTSDSPSERTMDVEALTRAQVETWRRFYQQQNSDGLRRFLTDDFIVIDAAGNVGTKNSEVAWLAKNAWGGPSDFLYVIDRIVFLGPEAAIVVGHGSGTRTREGGVSCIETYRSSNVFRKVAGKWRPVMAHVSGSSCISRSEYDALYDRNRL